jgi:hypothetical protein
MSILNKLTEGIVNRNLSKDGAALRDKWEKTGLLEGLGNERSKDGMAVMLENQAKELLREVSTMSGGDVEGFAAVAFPIVRRVFGSLVANELVSVQPMSLPSGLIFFLDFTFNSEKLGEATDGSLFGGGVVGHQITGGVDLTNLNAERSFYNLNNGYSSPTSSGEATFTLIAAGQAGVPDNANGVNGTDLQKLISYDPDLSGSSVAVVQMPGDTDWAQLDVKDLVAIAPTASFTTCRMIRRLSSIPTASDGNLNPVPNPNSSGWLINMVFQATGTQAQGGLDDPIWGLAGMMMELTAAGDDGDGVFGFPITDNFDNVTVEGDARGLGAIVGATSWGLEDQTAIPEIDIKVDSVSVTAMTKKLKAKWTPELGQDLNAYHNLDAEVELTSILSEQIALEIDREILEDLLKGATAGTLYWSRLPGNFLNRESGASLELIDTAHGYPEFTGTVSEWYETLIETINDVSARIHRKTLRGGANFCVVSPEVANLLEFTTGFRANVTADDNKGTVGAVNVGNLSKKWDVFVDPYFPRNVILVGRKGNSFLESGFVYAPYVPLQVTPTIFGPEDFVPRKGVMTRYAKKMVRPDMYGVVVVKDLV